MNPDNAGRAQNSMMNLAASLIGQVINMLVRFGSRTIFIYTLGNEYLGLNGLFSNILSLLSFAELGIGASITFSLYEPIARNDESKILALMNVYKKSYLAIAAIIFVCGSALTPFLSFFVAEMPDIPNIQLIYVLFVLNSSASYLFSYKASYVTANQKNYIVSNLSNATLVITSVIQCVVLLVWKNYIVFLVLMVCSNALFGIILSAYADRRFPVLKRKAKTKLDQETKNTVIKNVFAQVFHRIGSIVVFSTDNILLSKLFGVGIVGLYSNYSLLMTTVEGVLAQVFAALTASVGNLRVETDTAKQGFVYDSLSFMQFWLYSFSATAFAVLFNPFITLWLGDQYMMEPLCVAFIVINFYIKGMRQTNIMFNSAYGLMCYYQTIPLIEVTINLVASVILAFIVGPAGIFIGTTISTVLTMFWIEPFILFKHGFSHSLRSYFANYTKYTVFTVVEFGLTYFVASKVLLLGVAGFACKMLAVLVIPNVIVLLFFWKTEEFRYIFTKVLNVLRKLVSKFTK